MIKVMIAGLPGKMAKLVAEAISDKAQDMELARSALSELDDWIQIGKDLYEVKLFPLGIHKGVIATEEADIIVDFTAPGAVNRNAELYCKCKVPFVMGTTGGDREALMKTVKDSLIPAVIAPNMAKQIVVFQAMMEYAAKTFPNSFKGYRLLITESHQQNKKDTSGTAKAMVQYFNELGIPFTADQIIMNRDPVNQEVGLGVPAQYLDGHGWHTYTLLSADGTVNFEFTHNVNGRSIYIEGVLDAIRFLARQKKGKGRVFSMIDVLKG